MNWQEKYLNKITCGDCLELMKELPDEIIDLTITSPPYDNLRDYEGYNFNFEEIATELYRITKKGAIIVWIIGDMTIDGSESGTSFAQALYFKSIGFNLHDTMIWNKNGFSAVGALKTRYASVFEYMFIFSKGKINVFNPIKDRKTLHGGKKLIGTIRQKNGTIKSMIGSGIKKINEYSQRYNIWNISPQRQSGKDKHPAPFPEKLVQDHILSWSNKENIIFDPMCGSGTSCISALKLNRNFIGFEISQKYVDMANERISIYEIPKG